MGIPDEKSSVAKNLEIWLHKADLDAKEASIKAGLGETYAGDIIRGRSKNPSGPNLAKLAAVLGCTTSDLTGVFVYDEPHSRDDAPLSIPSELGFIDYTATPSPPIKIDPKVLSNLLNSPTDREFFSLWVRLNRDTKEAALEILETLTRFSRRKRG